MKRRGFLAKLLSCAYAAIACALPLALAGCGETPPTVEPPTVQEPVQPPVAEEKRELALESRHVQLILGDETLGHAPLRAEPKLNGEAAPEAELSYRIENGEIAEVDENGVLTAKQAGKTRVEVAFGEVKEAAEVTVYAETTEEQINKLDGEGVNLFGRTYALRGALVLDNVATGLEFCIYGNAASVEITATADCYFTVFIDGAENGSRVKAKKGTESYALLDGAEEGIHTVRLLKSSEINVGRLSVKKITGAQRYLVAPAKSDLLLEFIGDSITTGYGALGRGNWSIDNSDVCASFSYRTAQMLGADFSIVAREGICVNVDVWGIGIEMSRLYRYTSLTTQATYPFADEPDAVVIGLGTNDASYLSDHPEYAEQFPKDYKAFLTFVREKRPNARIVCVYGMMGANPQIESGIRKAIEELDDEKITYFSRFTRNSDGAVGHPSAAAQKKYAETLSEYLRELLAIK